MIEASLQNFHKTIKETPTILVYFSAPWCAPCRDLSPRVEKLSEEFPVIKVNTDELPDLAAEFNIRGLPTLMLFKNGESVKTQVGNLPNNKLKEFVA